MPKFYLATSGTLSPPLYADPGSSSTTNLFTIPKASLDANTYWHPFYVAPSTQYNITGISLTKAKLSVSANMTINPVIYYISDTFEDPASGTFIYTYSRLLLGTQTPFSSTALTELVLPFYADGQTTYNFIGAAGTGTTYYVGFQASLPSGSTASFQVLHTTEPTVQADITADRNISTEYANSRNPTIIWNTDGTQDIVEAISRPASTTLPDKDFHMALIGDGPPPTPTYVSASRGNKTIGWNFSVPSGYDSYNTNYITSSNASLAKSGVTNTQTDSVDFSSTTDFAELVATTGYYGYVYISSKSGLGQSSLVRSSQVIAAATPTVHTVQATQQGNTNVFTVTVTYSANGGTMQNIKITPSLESTITITSGLINGQNQTLTVNNITTGWDKDVDFSVTATNRIDGVDYTSSPPVVSTPKIRVPVEPQKPNVTSITSLIPTGFNPNQVTIGWSYPGVPSGSSEILSYRIYRCPTTKTWNSSTQQWEFTTQALNNPSWTQVGGNISHQTGQFTYSIQDNGTSAYTAYVYRVDATNATGTSNGNQSGVLTDGGRVLVATATGFSSPQYQYLVDPSNTATRYRVYRYTGSGIGGWEPTPF